MKFVIALVTVVLATATAVLAQSGLSKELQSLQGTWVLTSQDGQALDASGPAVSVVITADKYTRTANGQVVERGTIKLDASKSPIAIDAQITEGEGANQTQVGVLQLSEDSVTVKLNMPGATTRPTDFVPADGYVVLVFKRVKTVERR